MDIGGSNIFYYLILLSRDVKDKNCVKEVMMKWFYDLQVWQCAKAISIDQETKGQKQDRVTQDKGQSSESR